MSNSVGRRDTLKLAGAAAALGAGLGMVLKAKDALADVTAPAPGVRPVAPVPTKMIIGPEVQIKIAAFEKVPVPKGNIQFKFHSSAGQFLYAANMPEEIAKLVLGANAGQVQIKFYRPESPTATLATQSFGEGLVQLVPSTGQR